MLNRITELHIGLLALVVIGLLGVSNANAQYKKIPTGHSKIDVRIDGLDQTKLQHFVAKPSPEKEQHVDRYAAYLHDGATDQFIFANVEIAINDEIFWEYVADTTVDSIKGLNYFKNKSVVITGMSSGMNSGYDSAAGDPNYLLFTADDLSCGKMRRFSAFGPHGGIEEPYAISAFYCAPRGEELTKERAAKIAKSGLIYRPRTDHLGNDLHPPPKL